MDRLWVNCATIRGVCKPLLARGELMAKGLAPRGRHRVLLLQLGQQGALATRHPSSGHPAPTFPDSQRPRAGREGDRAPFLLSALLSREGWL